MRSQLIDNNNNPTNNAKNPRTLADPISGSRFFRPSAKNRAATFPESSARIMAAVPQYRRAWNLRRNTTARRRDLERRILNWVWEIEVGEKMGWCWF